MKRDACKCLKPRPGTQKCSVKVHFLLVHVSIVLYKCRSRKWPALPQPGDTLSPSSSFEGDSLYSQASWSRSLWRVSLSQEATLTC